MNLINNILYLCTIVLSTFGLYILYETKKAYERENPLPLNISLGWWILDIAWTLTILLSAYFNVWQLKIDEKVMFIGGLAMLTSGTALLLAGVAEFHSINRLSGLEVSKLITTGIYSASRNPQFLGFYIIMLGLSIIGRSGYALLITIVAIIYCHYYIVKLEEPYLERIFGEEYSKYKLETPRYIGWRRKANKPKD